MEEKGYKTEIEIKMAMCELDAVEAHLREIWPDGKPVPTVKDPEFSTWYNVRNGMVHICDLKEDLQSLLDD